MTDEVSTNLNDVEREALESLRANVITLDQGWGFVYSENARPRNWTELKWDNILGRLATKGLFDRAHQKFGYVRLNFIV